MTDKIIIDGVDVSGCEFLKYDKIGCDIDETYCNCTDCHYKQLRREKEKVKELEEENSILKTASIMIDNNKYKQALEEIKEMSTVALKEFEEASYFGKSPGITFSKQILQKCEVLEDENLTQS